MSLQAAADLLARHGREGDSVLVHMSPEEVRGLQQLAEMHGTTLTINPHTGMPEAFNLKDLVKAVAPIALGAFLGPGAFGISGLGLSAGTAGLITGGVTTALTGSLEKGLMAGLGAYGGAGMASGMQGLGEASLAAGNQSAAETARLLAQAGEVAPAAAQEFATANAPGVFTAEEAMKEGLSQAVKNPSALYDSMGKDAWKYTAAAAAPVAQEMSRTQMPDVPKYTPTAAIHPKYAYRDQEGNVQFVDLPGVKMEDWKPEQSVSDYVRSLVAEPTYEDEIKRAAEGGLMDQSPMVNDQELQYQNSPVVRMADGGAAGPDYSKFDPANYIGKGTVSTQAEVDAANAARAASLANAPGQWADGKAISSYLPGFNPNDLTTQQTLGELNWRTGGADTTSQNFAAVATPAQAAAADIAWMNRKAELEAQDRAAGLLGANQTVDRFGNAVGLAAAAPSAKAAQTGVTLPPGASDTYRWYAERGLGFNPIDQSIDNWFAKYDPVLQTMPVANQEAAIRDALAKEGMNEADLIKATGMGIKGHLFSRQGGVTPTGEYGDYGSGAATGTDYLGNTVSIATPGDVYRNPDNTATVSPNIPGRLQGGFTGMDAVKSAYTAGGGRLGQVLAPTKTYQNTGLSGAAYDYLMGKGPSPVYTQKPPMAANSFKDISNPTKAELISYKGKAKVWQDGKLIDNPHASGEKAGEKAEEKKTTTTTTTEEARPAKGGLLAHYAEGGLSAAYAAGGMSGDYYNLGGYSDGGRLLRGPGDGVSDSIPATIGGKRPARLADGEFVVPARIVSEIGNGSTEAGARKLYAMMERVQQARKETVGKGRSKVAKNTRADKYLPV